MARLVDQQKTHLVSLISMSYQKTLGFWQATLGGVRLTMAQKNIETPHVELGSTGENNEAPRHVAHRCEALTRLHRNRDACEHLGPMMIPAKLARMIIPVDVSG